MGSDCQGCGEKNTPWIHAYHRCDTAEYGDGYCRDCWKNLFVPKLYRYMPKMHQDIEDKDVVIKDNRKYVMTTKRCRCGYKYNEREWWFPECAYELNLEFMSMTVDEYLDTVNRPEREKAAKVIQQGCENWLNAPKTKDGKMGIRLRVGMREMTGYNELYPPQF